MPTLTTNDWHLASDQDVAHCDRCESETEHLSIIRVQNQSTQYREREQSWCDDCTSNYAYYCSDCETRFSDNGASSPSGNMICGTCYESNEYFTCGDCGQVRYNDDYYDDNTCVACARGNNRHILDYGCDVSTVPVGNGPHYYGVELEVECKRGNEPNSKAEQTNSLLGEFAMCKHDGSLNYGYEIVTRPASLAKQIELWQPFFRSGTNGLRSFNTDTCGLHVHCSRKPLSELTIAKMVCFTNAAHNRRFMSVIAGRTASSWSKFKTKKLGTAAKMNSDRYEAVNLQNSRTIEFRIFKGTLRQASVFKAIEFCDSLIQFCLPARRALRECMMRSHYTEFVRVNSRAWPHISAFLDAKWYGQQTTLATKLGYKAKQQNQEEINQEEEQ